MKKFFKIVGVFILAIIIFGAGYYLANNEPLPEGKQGKEADALAAQMLKAINHEAFEKTEVIEWSFRNVHTYRWHKSIGLVGIRWDDKKVMLDLHDTNNSTVFINDKKVNQPELVQKAIDFFNNDSFWLVAPYKIFDSGTQRSIVKHEGKDALLVTYTSGGSTPGDSYLWILDENNFPISYKMWTSILPLGGLSATWSDWKNTEAGIQLPTKHSLSLFGMELDMGAVKAYNEGANMLANKVLKAIKHESYQNTRYLEWSFGGRRSFLWDKTAHVVDVSWEDFKVHLYPADIEKSIVYFEGEKQEDTDEKIVKRAWDIFNNDSFWLVGPHKIFDEGVIRNIKKIDGKDALQVTYTKGGTTPGDSYIWILDDNYIPTSFKMTVPSMKMKEVPATWEDWITTESGTLLPTNHTFSSGGTLSMGEVKGYN